MMNPNSGRNSGQPNRGKKVNEFFFFHPSTFAKIIILELNKPTN